MSQKNKTKNKKSANIELLIQTIIDSPEFIINREINKCLALPVKEAAEKIEAIAKKKGKATLLEIIVATKLGKLTEVSK